MTWRGWERWVGVGIEDENEKMAKEYKRWKIGNIGYIVGPQELKWQQIGNTIGNNRQHPSRAEARPAIGSRPAIGAWLDLVRFGLGEAEGWSRHNARSFHKSAKNGASYANTILPPELGFDLLGNFSKNAGTGTDAFPLFYLILFDETSTRPDLAVR